MRTDADEKQISEMQVEEFLEKLSSKAPVPGGGGASLWQAPWRRPWG